MSIASVTRELLVRYLDTWVVGALRRSRRVSFVQVWTGDADVASAEAALRVFAEFGDRMRGRQLSFVVAAPHTDELRSRLDELQADLNTPAELGVYPVEGADGRRLRAALTAVGATDAPLLGYLDAADPAPLVQALPRGRAAELLLLTSTGSWDSQRQQLTAHGYPLCAGVDLVTGPDQGVAAHGPAGGTGDERLVAFATSSAKSLEAYKNELWAVDEFAGVRFRDPTDPGSRLVEINLNPDPGPLRRELLLHLSTSGERTVTQLRHFTLTDTVYRVADTERALSGLLAAGAVTRRPEHGRLAGDVLLQAVPDAAD